MEFFKKIRQVHIDTPLNITTMTEAQWYRLYLEDYCTMEELDNGQSSFIPTRIESASPTTDWEKSWRLARLKGLGPEHTSFLFRLGHKLLVTKERLNRTNAVVSPFCQAQGCTGEAVENLEHALVQCSANSNMGSALMHTLRLHHLDLPVDAALRLELEVEEEQELPLVWLMAATLLSIWEQRQEKGKVQPYLVRAQLEAKINLIRKTRFVNCATILDQKVQSMFDNVQS